MDITKHFSFEGKALTTQTDENGLYWLIVHSCQNSPYKKKST